MLQSSIVTVIGATVLIALILVVAATSMTLSTVVSSLSSRTVVKNGHEVLADVVDIGQTGVTLNNVPLMRIALRIDEGSALRDVTIKQFIDLGNIPRRGERVRVLVDPTEHSHVIYLGLAGSRP